MRPFIPGLDSDLGRMRHSTFLNRLLCLLDGVKVIVTSPSSLRAKRLVAVGGLGETRTMGGERAKQLTPVVDGEAEKAAAEDGEGEGAGPRLVMSLVRVVADGVPPARTMILPIQPSRSHRMKPSIPTLRFRPHQITPGARRVPPGAHLRIRLTTPGVHPITHGVRLVGAPQTTLGRHQPKPHRMNLSVTPALTKRRERDGGMTSRVAVGRVGVTHPTPRLPPVCIRPEGAGEIPLRLSPRSSVLPKVPTLTLSITFLLFYCHCAQNGALT